MARFDFRNPVRADALFAETNGDASQEQIDRIFFELALEMGMTDLEMMFSNTKADEITLVYDKFSLRRR